METIDCLIIYLSFSLLCIWLYRFAKWSVKRRNFTSIIDKIPGPDALPIVGNTLEVNVSPEEVFTRIVGGCFLFRQWGSGILRVWTGWMPMVFLSTAKYVEPVLTSTSELEKSFEYTFLHPWLGTGLLTSSGSKWRSRRKLLTPAFHFKILDDFICVMNDQSRTLISKLQGKQELNIYPLITLCSLDIICEATMGCHVRAQSNQESAYVKAIYRMSNNIQVRQRSPWIWPHMLHVFTDNYRQQQEDLTVLKRFTRKVIEDRKEELLKEESSSTKQLIGEYNEKKRLTFLDLLLKSTTTSGQPLSNADIQEEVDTFMFEGHDTTAAGITWTLFLIGLYPEIQKKCYKELQDIFGESTRVVTSEDLRQMKYLERCIKEAQRLYPSVPMLARSIKEGIKIGDHYIPGGTTALINTYALHRDPEVWYDPEKFDPDRFLPERTLNMNPYAYVPFSAGPRNCIGQRFAAMEEKIVVSSVLRKFHIESCDRRDSVALLAELVLRPKDGIRMRLTSRA